MFSKIFNLYSLKDYEKKIYHFLSLVLVLLLLTNIVKAQLASADILGTVTDTTGASVVGAEIKIENLGTHQIRTTVSGVEGGYTFSLLQPGTYSISITAQGFKGFLNPSLLLVAGDRTRVNASLSIGANSEIVEVTGQTGALQTDSVVVGTSVDSKAIQDLPLNGRNIFSLVQLSPGVNGGSPNSMTSGSRPDDRRSSSSISANGLYESLNNNLIDGLDNNERYKGLILIRPSVEAIESVRVDTNLFTAEVGRSAGAVINVVTKSGSNNFHGSIFEYFRNDITDARNFFARSDRAPHKPELRQNQFGGSISGPIVRDHTFVFADIEAFRQVDATGSVFYSTVPTLYEEQHPGDLSDISGPVIPVGNIDPTALGYFKLYPTPNLPGTTNNYFSNPAARQKSLLGDIRIDHHFNTSNTLYVRYSYNGVTAATPAAFPSVNGVVGGGGSFAGSANITTHNGQFNYTHIFTPHLLLELRAGYGFFQNLVTPINYGTNVNDLTPYSIPNANACLDCSGLASVRPASSYTALGDATFLPIFLTQHNYQYQGNLTYTHGNQTIKMGGSLGRRLISTLQNNYGKGQITFSGSTPVQSLMNFFIGKPFNYQRQSMAVNPHLRTWESNAFVQDDWRALPHLTLNMGVRYDVFTAPNEENGQYGNLNLNTAKLVVSPNAGINTSYVNVAPRFGFVANVTPKTVIRGGFGLTFFASDIQYAFVLQNPPLSYSSGSLISSTPLSAGIISPANPSTTSLAGSVVSKPFNFKDTYIEQFNLLVQRELSGNVVTVGYVGELGRHLQTSIPNIDIPAPSGSSVVPSLLYATQLPNVNTIQFYGDFAASSYNSLQISFERRLRNGLTLNANYTLAHALDDYNYTNDNEAGFGLQPTKVSTYDYGNSYLDMRNRIAVTANYAISAPKTSSALVKNLVGDWQINGISYWQTGTPLSITSSVTQNNLAYINLPTVTSDRPDRISPIFISNPSPTTGYFNVAAFARQAIGTAGNAGRNIVYGPHQRRTDLSLFRTFPIHEQLQAQFRAECFNISNTPNFAQPGGGISAYSTLPNADGRYTATTAGNFGIITSTATGSAGRQFQFALKILF